MYYNLYESISQDFFCIFYFIFGHCDIVLRFWASRKIPGDRIDIDIVFHFLVAMRTLDEGERAWLPAPIPEC